MGTFMGLPTDVKLSKLGKILGKVADKDDFKKRLDDESEKAFTLEDRIPYLFMIHAVLFMALGENEYENTYSFPQYMYKTKFENRTKEIDLKDAKNDLGNKENYTFDEILEKINNNDPDLSSFIDFFNFIATFYLERYREELKDKTRDMIKEEMGNTVALDHFKYILDREFMCDDHELNKIIEDLNNSKLEALLKDETEIYKSINKVIDEESDKKKYQIVFTGAPGTGKTYGVKDAIYKILIKEDMENRDYRYTDLDVVVRADAIAEAKNCVKHKEFKDRFNFVQFHSSYDYTDLVEGLRPAVIGHDDNGKPVQAFVRMDGSFKKFCRAVDEANKKAENNNEDHTKKPYFFVIDEINRADLSRVFGELMYCVENRGTEGSVETQYAGLPTYHYPEGKDEAEVIDDDIYRDKFYIPENIVVIGTMNDIDRSVETFDFALRRRFKWVKVKAADSLKKLKNVDPKVIRGAEELNRIIYDEKEGRSKYHLGEEYQLGISYFKPCENKQNVDRKKYFDDELSFILNEYMRGRPDREAFINDCREAFTKE